MSEIEITAKDQLQAMSVELTRLQRQNINLRAALFALQERAEKEDDPVKIGGTD